MLDFACAMMRPEPFMAAGFVRAGEVGQHVGQLLSTRPFMDYVSGKFKPIYGLT